MRQPWTVRVAAWSARHRWLVFGLWLVLTIGLFVASLAAGGTLSADAVDNDGENQATFESARAYDVFNAAGTPTEDPVHRTLIVVGAADGPLADAALDDVLARVDRGDGRGRRRRRAAVRQRRRSPSRATRGGPHVGRPLDGSHRP